MFVGMRLAKQLAIVAPFIIVIFHPHDFFSQTPVIGTHYDWIINSLIMYEFLLFVLHSLLPNF